MKVFENSEIKEVFCNQCGRKLTVENGIIKEGAFASNYTFGFFSQKDGITHSIDLCEECYDIWVSQFAIPITQKEETELL